MESNKIHFVASVDNEYLDQIEEIVVEMEKNGFSIERTRRITGTISGFATVSAINEVKIPGVNIEPEKTYYIQTEPSH